MASAAATMEANPTSVESVAPMASSAPAATPSASISASSSASTSMSALPAPAWLGDAKAAAVGDVPLVLTIGGLPIEAPYRQFVWSAPDKAWFLQVHSTLSGLTYVGPLFWFKKGQKPRKGMILKKSDGAGFSMATRKTDGSTAGWAGNQTSFEVEVLEFKIEKRYDPKGPHSQVVGKGRFRVALSLKGNGSDVLDSWAAGASDAEIVLEGGAAP